MKNTIVKLSCNVVLHYTLIRFITWRPHKAILPELYSEYINYHLKITFPDQNLAMQFNHLRKISARDFF